VTASIINTILIMKPIVGTVFETGRIDFSREDNAWVFEMIDSGLKDNQRDRIRFDPSQAPIQLKSAPINEGGKPDWMDGVERTLKTADSVYLQFRKGILRFRLATHQAGKDKQFVTLGTQEEVDQFCAEHWRNVRYFYALRRDMFQFVVNTMITHKSNAEPPKESIEISSRVDYQTDSNRPMVVFDSTGSAAPIDIIEWRSKVKEGEVGRFDPAKTKILFNVRAATRPVTLFHESRVEFQNHAYTFGGDKMWERFNRLVAKRLKQRIAENDGS
jgi:hypothetical protein